MKNNMDNDNFDLAEAARKAKEELKNQSRGDKQSEQSEQQGQRRKYDYSAIMNDSSNITKSSPEDNNDIYTGSAADLNNQDYSDNINEPIPDLKGEEELLFKDGPTLTEFEIMKKQFENYDLYVIEILKKYTFIFRTVTRNEYKRIVALDKSNALQREEILCDLAVLWWPKEFSNGSNMGNGLGGIPSTLSTIIMEKSGWTKEYAIQEI